MDRLKDLPPLPAEYVAVLLAATSNAAPAQRFERFDVQKPDSPGARIARLEKLVEY